MLPAIFMKLFLASTFILSISIALGQKIDSVDYVKEKYIIGFFPNKKPQIVYGLSIGPFSVPQKHIYNGLTFELIGVGLIGAFGAGFEDSIKRQFNKANGIILSGTGGMMNANGIYVGGFGLLAYKMNGISICLGYSDINFGNGLIMSGFNNCENVKGIQLGVFTDSENVKGIQIGMTNTTKKLRGIQIGIWNINEKRKFPIINWNFK